MKKKIRQYSLYCSHTTRYCWSFFKLFWKTVKANKQFYWWHSHKAIWLFVVWRSCIIVKCYTSYTSYTQNANSPSLALNPTPTRSASPLSFSLASLSHALSCWSGRLVHFLHCKPVAQSERISLKHTGCCYYFLNCYKKVFFIICANTSVLSCIVTVDRDCYIM